MAWYDTITDAVLAQWGESITYTPPVGDAVTVTAIVDEQYMVGLDIQGTQTVFSMDAVAVAANGVVIGGTFTRDGNSYVIKTVMPDSGGMIGFEVEQQ